MIVVEMQIQNAQTKKIVNRASVPKVFEKAKQMLETLSAKKQNYGLGEFLKEKNFEISMVSGIFEGSEYFFVQYEKDGKNSGFGSSLQSNGVFLLAGDEGYSKVMSGMLEMTNISFRASGFVPDEEIVTIGAPGFRGFSFYGTSMEVENVRLWASMKYLNQ